MHKCTRLYFQYSPPAMICFECGEPTSIPEYNMQAVNREKAVERELDSAKKDLAERDEELRLAHEELANNVLTTPSTAV